MLVMGLGNSVAKKFCDRHPVQGIVGIGDGAAIALPQRRAVATGVMAAPAGNQARRKFAKFTRFRE